ncbi:MAG: sulfatase-like hydrolase/transferase [Candidatus Contendobacter sp.]
MSSAENQTRRRLIGRWMANALGVFLALFVLNSALTFQNRWPTIGVRWVPELSVELAVLLLALVLVAAWRGPLAHGWRNAVLGLFVVLTLGRYLDVTAPALMGRSINLYWDSPHIPAVAALFLDRVAGWRVLLGGVALLALLAALFAVLRWALGTVMTVLDRAPVRRALGILSLVLLTLYGAGRLSPPLPTKVAFALPVTAMLAEQVQMVLAATVWRNDGWIAAQPPLPVSDLGRLGRGDVFVIFFESQGALVFDDPRFATPLAGDFAALERSLADAGWRAASARVESSTFGGLSWLAHSSLLSGLRIADQGGYRDLLTSSRPTLVSRFAAAGYRCVALMPGLRHPWPEGRFYGFDRILDAGSLEYRGPAYGGWVIPDQYSLYRLHQVEVAPADRPPLFVFFPTINSHAPFAPIPPYEPDWSRFDATPVAPVASGGVELNERVDGAALAATYIQSVRYNLAVLGGYLRQHAPANALLLVLGDHQPPAIVGGREISWQVPVQVFSRDPDLIGAFQAAGFRAGVTPGPAALGGIESLGPLLLRVLDSRPSTPLTAARVESSPGADGGPARRYPP